MVVKFLGGDEQDPYAFAQQTTRGRTNRDSSPRGSDEASICLSPGEKIGQIR